MASPPQARVAQNGEAVGSDIDLAAEIARRLDLYPVFVTVPNKSLVAYLNRGNCDIVIARTPVTTTQLAATGMVPYFHAGQVLIVTRGNPNKITRTLDLCNRTAGAMKGSMEYNHLAGAKPYNPALGLSANCQAAHLQTIKIAQYGSFVDALAALKANKIAAFLAPSAMAGYLVSIEPDALELVSGVWLDDVKEGIMVSKSKPGIQGAVLNQLKKMLRDGTYLQILQKYGMELDALTAIK
jgi:polar amino acid transport system substrate-binding protein